MPISAEHWEARIGRRVRLRDLHILLTVVQTTSMAKAAQRLPFPNPRSRKRSPTSSTHWACDCWTVVPREVEPASYGSALVKRALGGVR